MRYIVNGITDERDACDCCGKTGLKRVVVLTDSETGEFVFFGTTCAARAMKVTAKDVRAAVKTAEDAKRAAARAERDARAAARTVAWHAHLEARVGRVITDFRGDFDTFAMIEAAGGYTAAREGFSWAG